MTTKDLIELVKDFGSWRGDVYTLATLVYQRQKEDDAAIAEQLGDQATADAIRGQ
jgi:hypothetical protein